MYFLKLRVNTGLRLARIKKNNFRFHHISTDEVYGDLPHPDEVENRVTLSLFTETTAYAPSSPILRQKHPAII